MPRNYIIQLAAIFYLTDETDTRLGKCWKGDVRLNTVAPPVLLPVFLIITVGFNRPESSLFVYYIKSVKQITNTIAFE